jgi:hypothetical protein
MYLEPLAISLFWEKRKKKKLKTRDPLIFKNFKNLKLEVITKSKNCPEAHYNCLALSIFSLICKCN